jgi:hypothetical protein
VSTPLCQTTPDFQAKFAAKMPGMCKNCAATATHSRKGLPSMANSR